MTIAFGMPFISNPSAVLCPLLRITASAQNEGYSYMSVFVATITPSSFHFIFPCYSSQVAFIQKPCDNWGDMLTMPFPSCLSCTCSSALNTAYCREDDIVKIQWSCHLKCACSNCCLCSRQVGSDLGDSHIKHNWKLGNHIWCSQVPALI